MSFEMTLEGIAAFLAEGGTAREVVLETYRRIEACPDPAVWISLRPQEDVLAEAGVLDRSAAPRKRGSGRDCRASPTPARAFAARAGAARR